VEEVTASAQMLAEMAQSLQEVVAQFKLNAENQAGANEHKPAAFHQAAQSGNGKVRSMSKN
jgi:hypothetical protein